ncbi:hypothetical protein NKH77_23980 [Streptomyces sp. M19]
MDWWHVESGPFGQVQTQGARSRGSSAASRSPNSSNRRRRTTRARSRTRARTRARAHRSSGSPNPPPGRGRRGHRPSGGPAAAAVAQRRQGDRPSRSLPAPTLLLAIALLVAGAIVSKVIVLAFGWLVAYLSRRLSRAEAKWAVLGMPGLVVAGAMVWLWGARATAGASRSPRTA